MSTSVLITDKNDSSKRRSAMERMRYRDWRQALRTPHVYRVGNSTLRIQSQFFFFIILLLVVAVIFYGYARLGNKITSQKIESVHEYSINRTYPLTKPIHTRNGLMYAIGIITDLDKKSKSAKKDNTWNSFYKKGYLTWTPSQNSVSVSWDNDDMTLSSTLGMKGRGMELSELVVYDGKLLSFDDRTGAVYIIEKDIVYPWLILMDGDGKNTKGMFS